MSLERKFTDEINLAEEQGRKVTAFSIEKCILKKNKVIINRWIWPPIDIWIMKSNLLLQRNNDEKQWIDLFKNQKVGYQYVTRWFHVREVYEPKLRAKIDLLVTGFMRKDKMNISGIFELVLKNIDCSIVIFRQLYVKSDPPKLVDPPIDTLTSGFMRNIGICSISTYKLILKYIDEVSGMYLEWDRTLSLEGEELEGDSECVINDFDCEKYKVLFEYKPNSIPIHRMLI